MAAVEPEHAAVGAFDERSRAVAEGVLRQAFVAAQLAMPSEDMDTAVHTLWITLESLLVDHVAPGPASDRAREPLPAATHWRRLVNMAVTHTFVLSGGFVTPEESLAAVAARAGQGAAGRLWHTRRPPGQGALVLGAHEALLRLDATAAAGRFPDDTDAAALLDLIALATLGVVLAEADQARVAALRTEPDPEPRGRWARDGGTVAAAFGIPDVHLVPVSRDGWACDECGCLFAGRVEGGVAYPDRMAPVGRTGPCDTTTTCACHAAPVQRHVR
jgi:hypothetical protein